MINANEVLPLLDRGALTIANTEPCCLFYLLVACVLPSSGLCGTCAEFSAADCAGVGRNGCQRDWECRALGVIRITESGMMCSWRRGMGW